MRHIKYLIIAIVLAFHVPISWANIGYSELPTEVRKTPEVAKLLAKDPNKVQVVLFFSYACGACARFEPHFDRWLASHSNKNFAVYRFPVTFGDDEWQDLANLYYIAQNLDPTGELNSAIFTAIYQHGARLWEKNGAQEFFVAHGFTAAQFDAAYAQHQEYAQARAADELSESYGINYTPALIVNDMTTSYIIDTSPAAGDCFKVLDQLINNQLKK